MPSRSPGCLLSSSIFLFFFFPVFFFVVKTHNIKFTILTTFKYVVTGNKYLHNVVYPSPPSISRTFLTLNTETPSLNNNSLFLPPVLLDQKNCFKIKVLGDTKSVILVPNQDYNLKLYRSVLCSKVMIDIEASGVETRGTEPIAFDTSFKVKSHILIIIGRNLIPQLCKSTLLGWRGSLIIMRELGICKVVLGDFCLHHPIKRKFPQ